MKVVNPVSTVWTRGWYVLVIIRNTNHLHFITMFMNLILQALTSFVQDIHCLTSAHNLLISVLTLFNCSCCSAHHSSCQWISHGFPWLRYLTHLDLKNDWTKSARHTDLSLLHCHGLSAWCDLFVYTRQEVLGDAQSVLEQWIVWMAGRCVLQEILE